MRRPRDVSAVLTLAAAAMLCGCQERDPSVAGRTPTYHASGRVTYNGEAVTGAHVSLHPGDGGVAAFGRTDQNGRFELQTYEAGDGAAAGSYTVTIEKMSVPTADQSKSSSELFAEMERQAESGEPPSTPEPTSLLPDKYRTSSTSELTAEVTAAGPNEFTFELTD